MKKDVIEILDINSYYILTEENWYSFDDNCIPNIMEAAYSVIDGSYIGDKATAVWLSQKDIVAEAINGNKVASIGFCQKEQKWYGWSHRAIYGFGIGSVVKHGDCAYMPSNPNDMLNYIIGFWSDTKTEVLEKKLDVMDPYNKSSNLGAFVKIRTTTKDNSYLDSVHWEEYPSIWGRGEWTAETLEDAKQMAIDFAKGVS